MVMGKAFRGRFGAFFELRGILVSFLLVVVCAILLFASLPAFAYADTESETYEVTVEGTYHQTEAYSMLAMINKFRTAKVNHSDENTPWYKAEDGSYVDVAGLSELKWDSGLEKIAMQRAAEAALRYDATHTRPNGKGAESLTIDGRGLLAENLAKGRDFEGSSFWNIEPYYYTPNEVFVGWREDGKKYDGQGHRRNMLLSGSWGVGIACFELNGVRYWAMDLGSSEGGSPSLKEGISSVKVEVLNSAIAEYSLATEEIGIRAGDVASLPLSANGTMHVGDEENAATFQAPLDESTWEIKSGSDVVSLNNGAITALRTGSAVLTNTALGKEVACNVTVTAKLTPALNGVPASASVALSAKTYKLSPTCNSTGPQSFNSSDESVTTVDGNGTVTLKKAGTATITVSYAETDACEPSSASCKLTITDGSSASWTKDPDKNNSWFAPDGTQVIVAPAKVSAPAKTSISKLIKGKKAVTVKWKKKSDVTGYQIRYSLKSSMKGSKTVTVKSAKTTSKKVKKLKKKKKYYVQVRTYKVVNGKTYWSSWSAKKSVKTK